LDGDEGEEKEKPKTIKDLVRDLKAKGVRDVGKKSKKPRLLGMAVAHGIPVTKLERKVVKCWVGKPKGVLQILWERGFIDPNVSSPLSYYTMKGPKDQYGNIIKKRSLEYMASQLYDFTHETSMLQHVGNELGVGVDRTPKCHPEMAGEGIEYSWGCGKNRYQLIPLREKRTKVDFLSTVRSCMSQEYITKDKVRRFSRRAQRYMLAYYILAMGVVGEVGGDDTNDNTADHEDENHEDKRRRQFCLMVEKLLAACKTHRCAMDFDTKFIAENSAL
jgi:hypothetical protein